MAPLLLLLSGWTATPTSSSDLPADVFVSGTHGYQGFRIPAIVLATDGTLLAFAEGRRHGLGDAGDVDLVMATSSDKGRTWSPPRTIADEGANFIGNPAPVVDERDGAITVLLTWKAGAAHERDIRDGKQPPATIWATRSLDHGRTFSKAAPLEGLNRELLGRGWRWNVPGPGHAIQLKNGPRRGRLVCAANHSSSGGEGNAFLGAQALLSDDGGVTWRLGAVDEAAASGRPGAAVFPNESTVAEMPDGTLVFSARDEGGPAPATRGIARSVDGGESFQSPYAPDPGLAGPACQGSLLLARDGALLASLPADPKARRVLQIRVSRDGGATWNPGPVLVEGPAAYSDLIELAPGRFLAVVEVDGYRAIRAIPFSTTSARE
jgi:sialidase-1